LNILLFLTTMLLKMSRWHLNFKNLDRDFLVRLQKKKKMASNARWFRQEFEIKFM